MAVSSIPSAPPDACPNCGSPLAEDQRYCLNCGARPGEARLPANEVTAWTGADAAAATNGTGPNGHLVNGNGPNGGAPNGGAPAPRGPQRDWMPLIALGGLATLALVLVVGVLIGKSGNNSGSNTPQVITIGGGVGAGASAPTTGGTATTPTANTTFTADWPSGRDGWTIEIGSLDKASSTPASVATERTAATARGVSDVGALDSDSYPSLPSGQYILYSGSYDSQSAARSALSGVRGSYPSATVVQVSQSAGSGGGSDSSSSSGSDSSSGDDTPAAPADRALENSHGSDFERRSAAAPRTQVTGGKLPRKEAPRTSGFDTLG